MRFANGLLRLPEKNCYYEFKIGQVVLLLKTNN